MNKEIFARIPNTIFSIKTDELNSNGTYKYISDGSIYREIKDDKVIKIIYNLIIGTNFKMICNTSINELITLCGYKENR